MKSKFLLSCLLSCLAASLSTAMEKENFGSREKLCCENTMTLAKIATRLKIKEKAACEESLASPSPPLSSAHFPPSIVDSSPKGEEKIIEEVPSSQHESSPDETRTFTLITPKIPISTGFFDILDQQKTRSTESKKEALTNYVKKNEARYQLIVEQLGVNYFQSHFIDNESLAPCIHFIRKFFETKIDTLKRKEMMLLSHQEQLSQESRETFKFSPIGTYSGKLHQKSEQQEEYAYNKYKIWDFIYQFVSHYPITKGSTNTLIQASIKNYFQEKLERARKIQYSIDPQHRDLDQYQVNIGLERMHGFKVSSILSLINPVDIDTLIQSDEILRLDEIIPDKYSLLAYSKKQREKWHERCGAKQRLTEVKELFERRVKPLTQTSEN